MKDTMIDVMVSMMPFMKPFMWIGVAVAVIGLLLIVVQFTFKSNANKGIVWSARIVLTAAIFFIAAQIAGHFLSMPPTINFGDSSKFEFILVSFWQIGLAFFVAAITIKLVGSVKKTAEF